MSEGSEHTPSLGVALAGLSGARPPRAMIEWASAAGFRGVAIDGMAPGTRARRLDRSARRELAALLRRCELRFAGVDLWIPPSHFTSAEHQDRALAATIDAMELTAQIGRLNGESHPVVSMALPTEAPVEMIGRIVEAALATGVVVADHHWPPVSRESDAAVGIGVGIDPATALLAGDDPAEQVIRLGAHLACARLSDADQAGRTAVGAGGLDAPGYLNAIGGGGFDGLTLVDVRGLPEPLSAARSAQERWGPGA